MVLDLEPILTILNIHVKKHIGIDILNSRDKLRMVLDLEPILTILNIHVKTHWHRYTEFSG
jgi:hypothetical protein